MRRQCAHGISCIGKDGVQGLEHADAAGLLGRGILGRAGFDDRAQQDGRRELPSATGVIDVKAFLNALVKIGYDGPVRAEPFNKKLNAMPPDDACEQIARKNSMVVVSRSNYLPRFANSLILGISQGRPHR